MSMRPDDVVGYTYMADTYCPQCVTQVVHARKDAGPWRTELMNDAEAWLTERARVAGFSREDETTFDSDDFPKVIVREDEHELVPTCGACGRFIPADVDWWTVVVNMPGYMPMEEPYVTDDWEAARGYLVDELQRHAESLYEGYGADYHVASAHSRSMDEVIADLKAMKVRDAWSTIVPSSDSEHDLGLVFSLNRA